MTNTKHLRWMGLGTIMAFLTTLLVFLAAQAIIWTPTLIEIASVTWNDMPVI